MPRRLILTLDWFYDLRLRSKLAAAFGVICAVALVHALLFESALRGEDGAAVGLRRSDEAVAAVAAALERAQTAGARGQMASALRAALAERGSHYQAMEDAHGRVAIVQLSSVLLMIGAAVLMTWLIARSVAWPVQELTEKMRRVAAGDVDVEVWITSTDEFGTLARALEQVIRSDREIATAAGRLAQGDLAQPVVPRGERDAAGLAVRELQLTLGALLDTMARLIAAANQGLLDERGDAARFQGAFRDLVGGMNATLDALVQPLDEASRVMQLVAGGDVRVRMSANYRGQMATLQQALNAAVLGIDSTLARVSGTADEVSTAAGMIHEASAALAASASYQARSVHQSTDALGELADQISRTAMHADQLRGVARKSGTGSEHTATLRRLAEAMERIQGSSAATARVLSAMNDIATQTNLLALNAQIEAARAGRHGRGFAVVADEVRELASRSASALSETDTLIREAMRSADAGATIVKRVTEIVDEVASSSSEQDVSAQHIGSAIQQMSTTAEELAASSQQSAAAAEVLSRQAEAMRLLVSNFRHSGKVLAA